MGNMSYCMFRNTLNDLRECEEALLFDDELSPEEEKAKVALIRLCANLAADYLEEVEE